MAYQKNKDGTHVSTGDHMHALFEFEFKKHNESPNYPYWPDGDTIHYDSTPHKYSRMDDSGNMDILVRFTFYYNEKMYILEAMEKAKTLQGNLERVFSKESMIDRKDLGVISGGDPSDFVVKLEHKILEDKYDDNNGGTEEYDPSTPFSPEIENSPVTSPVLSNI